MNDSGRLRPRHRGGVRADGHQEGRVRQARRDLQAGRDPGHQHLGPEHRRDRLGDQAAGGGDRPALLLAGQRDEAAGDRPRRPHLQERDRHLHEAGPQDRQDRRPGRRLPRLRRQPHPRRAPARGQQADHGRGDALGHRPGALRLRLPHGPVRHERPGRPRHRLGEGEARRARPSATCCARWTAAARRPAPAGTTTTRTATPSPRRSPRRSCTDFIVKSGANPRQDRRRGDPRALPLSDDQRGGEDPRGGQGDPRRPTSMWSGRTATAGRSIAAARCGTATRSAWTRCWPR